MCNRVRQLLSTHPSSSYIVCFLLSVTPLILPLCLFLSLTHKHLNSMHVHTHAAVLNGNQPSTPLSFPSLSSERVCMFVYPQRGQGRSLRKEMNRCRTHGPPAEPNHFSCSNIYLRMSHWKHTLYTCSCHICIYNPLSI